MIKKRYAIGLTMIASLLTAPGAVAYASAPGSVHPTVRTDPGDPGAGGYGSGSGGYGSGSGGYGSGSGSGSGGGGGGYGMGSGSGGGGGAGSPSPSASASPSVGVKSAGGAGTTRTVGAGAGARSRSGGGGTPAGHRTPAGGSRPRGAALPGEDLDRGPALPGVRDADDHVRRPERRRAGEAVVDVLPRPRGHADAVQAELQLASDQHAAARAVDVHPAGGRDGVGRGGDGPEVQPGGGVPPGAGVVRPELLQHRVRRVIGPHREA